MERYKSFNMSNMDREAVKKQKLFSFMPSEMRRSNRHLFYCKGDQTLEQGVLTGWVVSILIGIQNLTLSTSGHSALVALLRAAWCLTT